MTQASRDFQILPAQSQDVPVLLELIHALAKYERMSKEVLATEESLATSLLGENSIAKAVLGSVDQTPVGYAVYFSTFSTFLGKEGLFLEDLFVLPEYRGQGFGGQLLSYVAQVAVQRNCTRLEWSALHWNTPAIEFYQAQGANIQEDWLPFRITGDNLKALATRRS